MSPRSLFISHGSPLLALGGHATTAAWRDLAAGLPRPRAVVVASAHWLAPELRIGAAAAPETIHDFYGFPAPLYEIRYPAPGAPELAQRLAEGLQAAGFAASVDAGRGLDHGVWVPLQQLWPDASVPVVPIALQPRRGPRHHLQLGLALAGLLDDEVLLIGSGSLTHNLHEAVIGEDDPARIPPYVPAFAEWFATRLAAHDIDALCDYRAQAPEAVRAHPTDEHLLPIFVALGAAGAAPRAERCYHALADGSLAMDVYAFTPG